MSRTQILSFLVENKPGVLFRVSSMIRRKGFNIDSITVGTLEQRDISRMTITVNADDETVEQMAKQLEKLIDVLQVNVLEPKDAVMSELALVKLKIDGSKAMSDIISHTNCRVVDVTREFITVELAGTPDEIDAFIGLASSFGIKELSRTGVTALSRG